MRPAILTLSLVLLAACGEEAPAPAPVEPAPAPAPTPEPEPAKAEPVVEPVMSDCAELTFTEGASGSYTITEGGDDHVKHHFEMPEGKDALVVDVTWPDEAWTFDVAAGVGVCPHHGKTYGTVEGTGSAHLYVPASAVAEDATSFPMSESWYVHLGAKGEQAVDASVAFTLAAKACVAAKVEAEAAPAPAKAQPPVIKPGAPKAIDRGPKAIGVKPVKKGH